MHARPSARARLTTLALLAPLTFAAPVAADVLTVDDDGPADFATVQEAVAAAAPGDVVLVEPGSYFGSDALVDVPLTLLGTSDASPPVLGFDVRITATPSTVAGLDLRLLIASGPGRVRVDDCDLRGLLLNTECEALVSGVSVEQGLVGVSISNGCTAALSDSSFSGVASAQSSGVQAIIVSDFLFANSQDVTLAGCSAKGGSTFDPVGIGGDGIRFFSTGASRMSVRGSSFHTIEGGSSSFGPDGLSIAGPALWSGVSPATPPVEATLVDPPEPYLVTSAPALLGTTTSLRTFGPDGQPAVLLGSLGDSTPFDVPGWNGGPFWVNSANLVWIQGQTLSGQETAAEAPLGVPGGQQLVGARVDFQALVLMPDGQLHLTNATQLVVRP